jgi:hypothetical protein
MNPKPTWTRPAKTAGRLPVGTVIPKSAPGAGAMRYNEKGAAASTLKEAEHVEQK